MKTNEKTKGRLIWRVRRLLSHLPIGIFLLFWRLKAILNSNVKTPELEAECDWKEGWRHCWYTKTPTAVSRWALSHNLRSQRCLTYTTMTASSTKRVPRRDRSKIMKVRMLYIPHKNFRVFLSQINGNCRTLPQKILRVHKLNSLSSRLVLWDRPSLKD